MLTLYYTDHFDIPLPPGHKFPMRKYRMLREALEPTGLFDLRPPGMATGEEAALAHDPAYVQDFLNGTLSPQAIRRIGFPYSDFMVRRTMASLGGTLAATRCALETGLSGCLAGGTHHAAYAEGSGFCVFNDIAVAIRALGKRAAVIDLDVHQGDGTASIFENDPAVFTFSMHGANNFPFRKQRSSLDIDLPDHTEDNEYLRLLHLHLPKVLDFAPEVIFFQAGVDALTTDKLGRLNLTPAGMLARDRLVFETILPTRIPLVITLGGGYSDPVEHTVNAHAATFQEAARQLEITR